MAFDYPIGKLFKYLNVGYYKYLGYDPNNINPYSFILVTCSRHIHVYTNVHSKQWTEDAVDNGHLIPLSNKLDDKIKASIQNYKNEVSNLNKISTIFNLPDDINILVSKNLGYLRRIDNRSHIIQNVY